MIVVIDYMQYTVFRPLKIFLLCTLTSDQVDMQAPDIPVSEVHYEILGRDIEKCMQHLQPNID